VSDRRSCSESSTIFAASASATTSAACPSGSAIGYDTQDHELDVIVLEDLQWFFKDDEKLDERVREGRYTESEMVSIRETGANIAAMLDARELWWDPSLRNWRPDPSWSTPDPVEAGWESAPWNTAS
jgi:hypothetical protein